MSATTDVPALREIPGPSAFGGGARRFFDLTWLLSVTEFKLNYFGTVFGYLWSLIRPLMLFGVLYVVFTRIIRFGGAVDHYAQVLLLSLTLYSLFSDATTRAVSSVVSSERHRPQDAVPAPGDPALGGAHESVQPRASA